MTEPIKWCLVWPHSIRGPVAVRLLSICGAGTIVSSYRTSTAPSPSNVLLKNTVWILINCQFFIIWHLLTSWSHYLLFVSLLFLPSIHDPISVFSIFFTLCSLQIWCFGSYFTSVWKRLDAQRNRQTVPQNTPVCFILAFLMLLWKILFSIHQNMITSKQNTRDWNKKLFKDVFPPVWGEIIEELNFRWL